MLLEYLMASTEVPVTRAMDLDFYLGNGTSKTITGGINLASASGGLLILKTYDDRADWVWSDTIRGTDSQLASNTVALPTSLSTAVTAFTSDGFSVGSAADVNTNNKNYFALSFVETPNYFEFAKITADDSQYVWTSTKNAALGMAIVKAVTGAGESWYVAHKGLASGYYLQFKTTEALNDKTFTISGNQLTFDTTSGREYMIYAFAEASDRVKSGSYVGDSAGISITLGWEPRIVLCKRTSTGAGEQSWHLCYKNGSTYHHLEPDTDQQVQNFTGSDLAFTSTGFTTDGNNQIDVNGATYVYTAWR